MRFNVKAVLSLRLLLVLVAFVAAGRAEAQETKPALPAHFTDHVTAKFHQQSLKQIVTALDKQVGLNILIDGEPLAPMADVACDGTLEEALNKLADTFDYHWKVGKGGIVLFNKRFRNRDDAPQANIAELTHLVNNMSSIFTLAGAEPDPSLWEKQLSLFYQSVTEPQRASLLDGKRLTGKDLSPRQLLPLRSAVLNNQFGHAFQIWRDLSDHLRAFDTAYLTATRSLQGDPIQPDVPLYQYEIFWHDRDGTLSSANIFLKIFGDD